MSILISVVVCTYNRADLLTRALQSLCDQTLGSSRYEVIVVDNNSEDNTREVTEEFRRQYHNVRYCFEPQQGLSYARNRGCQEAKAAYVAYIDDDCEVPNHWLATAIHIIENYSPAVFGGPSYPIYYTSKPPWYKDSYATHEPSKHARTLEPSEYTFIVGGNAFFRRTLLQAIGGFDVSLGMRGREIAYGEDANMLISIRDQMPDQTIYFDPRLYIFEPIRPEKMTMRWFVRERFAKGRYYFHRHRGRESPRRLKLLARAARNSLALATVLARAFLSRDRRQYPYIQGYLYEHAREPLKRFGTVYEQYREISRGTKVVRSEKRRSDVKDSS